MKLLPLNNMSIAQFGSYRRSTECHLVSVVQHIRQLGPRLVKRPILGRFYNRQIKGAGYGC